jgi:hypothetical protein
MTFYLKIFKKFRSSNNVVIFLFQSKYFQRNLTELKKFRIENKINIKKKLNHRKQNCFSCTLQDDIKQEPSLRDERKNQY